MIKPLIHYELEMANREHEQLRRRAALCHLAQETAGQRLPRPHWLRIGLGASQLTRSGTMKRLLATFLFAAGAYSLTLLAGTPAAGADSPAGVVTTPPSAVVSPATAALLADGDDVRARFIFDSTAANGFSAATGVTAAPDLAAPSQATAALADGDDIRARFIFETTK